MKNGFLLGKASNNKSGSKVLFDLKERGNIIRGDLIDRASENQVFWEKQNLLRHDSAKIAEIIMSLG